MKFRPVKRWWTDVGEVSSAANAAQMRRWNGESGRYWIAHHERHLAEHRHLLPHLLAAAGILPGERVLDVGCGCGATTIAAAQAACGPRTTRLGSGENGSCGSALGIDLSGPMLAVARRLAEEAGAANARFIRSDAQSCPVRPGSFDLVISSFGVMFFDDPAAAFVSLGAALRQNGRLAFLCWQHDRHNDLLAIPLRAFGAHTQVPAPASGGLFSDPELVTELLSSTGWADIRINDISEPAWVGTDVADVMTYIRGMPVIRDLAADLQDETLAERVLAIIAEQYSARQRSDGVWVRAAAWLVTARRR